MSEEEKPKKSYVEASVYGFLSRREHGREELERKLKKRDFPEDLIEEVLDAVEKAGYVDDERFAREQGAILARKCWGPQQISHKLRARGVDAAVVDRALDEIGEAEDWEARAKERLHSRFGRAEDLEDADRKRAFRHLSYRGFSAALIRRLLFDY